MTAFKSDFLRTLDERGWHIQSSGLTSIFAAPGTNGLTFFTTEPVDLVLTNGAQSIEQKTEAYMIYESAAE